MRLWEFDLRSKRMISNACIISTYVKNTVLYPFPVSFPLANSNGQGKRELGLTIQGNKVSHAQWHDFLCPVLFVPGMCHGANDVS